ncbi:unnamed protein product [Rotaria socialis]|uniref:NEL domain-containing protein n=1 Tax=Rotaria socialis TaxID=392032 RepID=A0A817TMP2_9BILA|nr:unnamed protein product [Rotaria socialis]CAF4322178.1 unnamed protein product [Rotaria socialis]
MDSLAIRGTSLAATQRRNQTNALQRTSNSIRLQSPSAVPQRRSQVGASSMRFASAQYLRPSPPKPMTMPELTQSLEAWQDPADDVQDVEAKKRIKDCFKQRSNTLDLSFLSLSTLPDSFGRMDHLRYLSLANNRFSEIPQTLFNLTGLKLLNFSSNVLTEVPDSFKEFQKLEFFNAECNQLRKVSKELVHLPNIKTVMLSHNRILKFPENIHNIKNLALKDQIPLASFGDFSIEFRAPWEERFQNEGGSGYFEIWLARYEEMLRLPEAEKYREAFKKRIGLLLDAMVKYPNLRTECYKKAQNVIATCHDGILFALYEMEIKNTEERMIASELSDEAVLREVERIFNFYRLQEFSLSHSQSHPYENGTAAEDEEISALETALFFYISPANTLEMPLGTEKICFMLYPDMAPANHDDVAKAVAQIQREKIERGKNFLIDFVLDKEYWLNYLSNRYADFIAEHTQVFMDQMEQLEAKKDKISDYDYLIEANRIGKEKDESEQTLYHQLTKNIVVDS